MDTAKTIAKLQDIHDSTDSFELAARCGRLIAELKQDLKTAMMVHGEIYIVDGKVVDPTRVKEPAVGIVVRAPEGPEGHIPGHFYSPTFGYMPFADSNSDDATEPG